MVGFLSTKFICSKIHIHPKFHNDTTRIRAHVFAQPCLVSVNHNTTINNLPDVDYFIANKGDAFVLIDEGIHFYSEQDFQDSNFTSGWGEYEG